MARKKPKPPIVVLEQKGVEIVDIDPLGLERTPSGKINNCALANGDEAKNCAMCQGSCPDATDTRGSVQHVSLDDARQLLTVPVDSSIWGGSPPHARAMKKIAGAIVRLRPPEGATDDTIAEVRAFFVKYGAEKVIVLPRPRAELLPSKVEKAKAVGAREAVNALVAEANSKDKAALEKLCERVMGEVGL